MSKFVAFYRMAGKDLLMFSVAVAAMGMASGIHETSFNNYLYDIFHIGASTRGILEFPRELPGLAAAFIAGALIVFGQIKVALIAMTLLAIGLVGLGFFSVTIPVMVFWMLIWSTGNHLFMPLEGSIAVALAGERKIGAVLGQLGAIRLAATMIGAGIIWIGMGTVLKQNLSYQQTYLIAAIVAVAGILILLRTRPIQKLSDEKQLRLVWRKEYSVFYALAFIHGIRKQIFITFAIWQLIQTFEQPASIVAQLWVTTSMIGIFFRPYLGRLSDRFGERAILLAEAPIVSLVFIGYAVAPSLGLTTGLYLMFACYISDSLISATSMARTSYASKIMTNKNDLTPTLAMGVSLDHASAMLMPAIGGLVWSYFGAHYLFFGAILIMILHGLVANYVSTEIKPVIPALSAT